ncbi:MAG: FHA domain-containing protein [Planctomycetota bacterium]
MADSEIAGHEPSGPRPTADGAEHPSGDTPGKGPESWAPVFENVITPRKIQRWLTEHDAPAGAGEPVAFSSEDIHDFRPRLRPAVPVLTVLDDGSRDSGEEVRIRGEVLRIGRADGDVTIPNDSVISHTHAEIRRVPWKGGFRWHLRDLESRNGTFVRCARAVLHTSAIVILGSRRFRLRNPLRSDAAAAESASTRLMDGSQIPASVWPSLEETTGGPRALRFQLRTDSLDIGRAGGGAEIQLDDPLLAYAHATLKRLRDGTWVISAERTRNGVWVSISDVVLGGNCYFRCGEQRFQFTIP